MTDIIGAYYGNSGRIKGAEEGSRMLRNAIYDIPGTHDGGFLDDFSDSDLHGADCLAEVVAFNIKLRDKLLASFAEGNKVFTVGGDHSISLGTMSAASMAAERSGENFGIIYIDAHGDLNTLENSPTKNLHGTALAALYGIGEPAMTAVNKSQPDISKLLLIGTRSLDDGEKSLIEKVGINIIRASEINHASESDNLNIILAEIDEFIRRNMINRIHLSFDIDVIDPTEAPGTGVPETDGLKSDDVGTIISHILELHPVKSVDIVEFNSRLDEDNKTFLICRRLATEILKKL